MMRKLLFVGVVTATMGGMAVAAAVAATAEYLPQAASKASPVRSVVPGRTVIAYEICYCKSWNAEPRPGLHYDDAEAVRQAIALADAPAASRPELRDAVAQDSEFLAEFLHRWLGPVKLVGIGTHKENGKDIIFAHWKRSGRPQDIYLREGFNNGQVINQIVIPLPAGATKRPKSFKAFLKTIFGSKRNGGPEGFHFTLWETPPNPEILGEGYGSVPVGQFVTPGYGLGLAAVRISGHDYLLLNAGRRLAGHYPESAISVAEHYPSLAEQAKSWDRARIMKELDQDSIAPYTSWRNKELLRELVRRGLQEDELRTFLGLSERPHRDFQWLGTARSAAAILTILVEAKQTTQYRAIIREAAIVPPNQDEGRGSLISQTTLAVLSSDKDLDFVPDVLSLLEAHPLAMAPPLNKSPLVSYQRGLIRYLGARADSEDAANRLLLVPISEPEDAEFRDLAVAQIRQRACKKRSPDAQCK